MDKYFSNWVAELKKKTLEEMQRLRNVPVLHASGNHILCGESGSKWCLVARAMDQGKAYNRKFIFNLEKKKNGKSFLKYKKYHHKMTPVKKLKELRHPFQINGNESLNMRNAEVAPKHKIFSRSPSLKFHIQNLIGLHNWGYNCLDIKVLEELRIKESIVLRRWLQQKERTKELNKIGKELPINKKKQTLQRLNKSQNKLYLECTKDPKVGSYGPSIGVHKSKPRKKKKK